MQPFAFLGTSDANGSEVPCYCTAGGDLCDKCYEYAEAEFQCNQKADEVKIEISFVNI